MTGEATLDPITLEVVRNALASTADEMALVLMRSAYSPVVRDTMDYSTALCDRHGRLVAQGLTLAVQLGSFPTMMRHLCEEHADTAKPGDVFITNDPYGYGGQHLPDIYVVAPIFVDDELEGYAATLAHHADVGGIAPGSIAVHATEIFQEGLRLPLLKLHDRGLENEGLLRVIEKNTRQPTQVLGDLRAQVAACHAGERGLAHLFERHGRDVRSYLERLQDTAERAMRAEIASLADGTYEAVDHVDGFGADPEPIEIHVALTIRGDELEIDFTGTSEQVDASLNCPLGLIHAACYCAIRGVTRADIPNCEGYMTPIRVVAPEGTVVNPVMPAACGARGVIGYRVYDAIMRALAQVVPDRVVAAGEGGPTLVAFGGYDEHRRPFGTTEVIVGAWGARATRDGLEGVSNPLANLSNQPIELLESDLPLEVVQYRLVPDSGGAGECRGGLAYEREYRVRAERATLTIRSDRRLHPPYGLEGGLPGAPSLNTIVVDGVESDTPPMPMTALTLARGDRFRHRSAGGGGFGSPLARDPAAVLEDVLAEKVSVAAARELYGVVVVDEPPSGRRSRHRDSSGRGVSIDVAIRNGRLIDGTGGPSVAADVGIAGERVVAIGEVPAATTEIDAAGLDVVPGFVDVHSHSDYTLLVDPRAVSALHQGVTTEVVGNCGHGCFPIADPDLAQRAIYGYTPSLPLTWCDAAGYFERLEAARPAVNVASLVPNGQLRLATVGLDDRPATRDELAAMRRHLEESLEQGAWGFSTGLEYAAERAASPDELGSLCVVCGRSGGLYATHTRYRDVGSVEAVGEAIETAERADVRLQVSHLVPRNGIDATRACIDRVERAAGHGLDVAFDMHTRLFGTTFLSAAVPPGFLRSDRIGSAEGRREAVEAMASYTSILSAGDDWSRIVLLDNDLWPEYARRDLASIAADRRQTAHEAICDLLAPSPEALGTLMVIIHCYTEDQQAEAFLHPLCAPGSDATTLAPDGPLASSFFHGAYTWAAWYLRFVVRERALLSLEEAVKRLTSDPAERVGLRDRGVLRVGAFADIAVLDSGAVRERGSTFEPNRLATGVRHVLVNGEAALTDGVLTARRSGKVLRR